MRQIVAELLEPCAVRRVTPCLFNCLQLLLNHDSSAVNLLLPLSEKVCEPHNEAKFRADCSQMDRHPLREFVAQLWLTLLLLASGFPLASLAQPLCTLQVAVRDNKRNPIAEAKISARLESPDYRKGVPYKVAGAARNLVGTPCSDPCCYPNFLLVDAKISRDICSRHNYNLTFSASGFHLTNHFDPLDVHANLSDSLNCLFFGNCARRFGSDFHVRF
jgi:hypothetical protein